MCIPWTHLQPVHCRDWVSAWQQGPQGSVEPPHELLGKPVTGLTACRVRHLVHFLCILLPLNSLTVMPLHLIPHYPVFSLFYDAHVKIGRSSPIKCIRSRTQEPQFSRTFEPWIGCLVSKITSIYSTRTRRPITR